MIENPILRGFCPDPSIIRVGDDYYIATSTFEWYPGVQLFHSTDLKNWEQIPSPLRRKSQLDLIGVPPSGGVWAPCLSYDEGRFYLIYTDVKTKKGRYYNTHNYLVHTQNIYGEWSEPIYLNSVGFDPSLFHDTDGKKYLVNMLNGFKGITIRQLDENYHLIGETRKIYNGSGIGCTEGPHLYHINEYYYLVVAEGGTGYEHCVTIARAKDIYGPYETAPNNPILTSDKGNSDMLQKCGHADLVETKTGEWYMVHLCARESKKRPWSLLGRETAIQEIQWSADGWPQLKDGGRFAKRRIGESTGEAFQTGCEQNKWSFIDDFEDEVLDCSYHAPRVDFNTFASCEKRKGYVRIIGRESLNSLHQVSLLAQRQQEAECTVETKLDFVPDFPEQVAGLAYYYDALHFYLFVKTVTDEGETVLTLLQSDKGIISDLVIPVSIARSEEVTLRACVEDDGATVRFYYLKQGRFVQMGDAYRTEILSDEHCRGFTGAHFGLYVHDMTGYGHYGDFDYFKIKTN